MKLYSIDERRARMAKSMWSMSDYESNSLTNEYTLLVKECYALGSLAKQKIDESKHEYIDYLCDKYAKNLANYYNKRISIDLMCPSIMISGAGNFPTRKKEKQNQAMAKNWKYYDEINAILNKIKNIKNQKIILSNDALIIEKLEEKINQLTEAQETMKNVNKYYKKNQTLDGCDLLSDESIEKLKENLKDDYLNIPFHTFKLTNNLAKIKRLQARLDTIKKIKEKGTNEVECKHFKVVENSELMRYQLLFDDIPDINIRTILKKNGFKWAPKNNAWQRQITSNTKYAIKRVIEELDKMEKK